MRQDDMMEDCAGAVMGSARAAATAFLRPRDIAIEERRSLVLAGLDAALAAASPRLTRPRTPWRSIAIHGGVAALWLVLFARSFGADDVFAWSAGLIYILYDTALIAFVFVQTRGLLRGDRCEADTRRPEAAGGGAPQGSPCAAPPRLTLAVIVAAHNEAAGLPATLRALLAQSGAADCIVVADDGSTDGTAAILERDFGLRTPPPCALSAPSALYPALRWLRLPHGGKARALNAALAAVENDLVATVDGDTLVAPEACSALRRAFAANAALVAATGVLTPRCRPSISGRLLEWFQTYEYIRNFLSRYAWARMDSLLLVSGAFAGFRRAPVLAVGGFDPACMVEDYELIHRLRRHSVLHGLGWTTGVVGGARATTEAPGSVAAFLRQRRRWFGGFLETQFWYRDMVGDARYGRLGLAMLPVKALDTLQPIYGLTAFSLLLYYVATARFALIAPVGGVILAKTGVDFLFHLWSVRLYRRWVDPGTTARSGRALLTSLAEPFTFQILRHTGALLGWIAFLTGRREWGRRERGSIDAEAAERRV
jgi:cellulose synthase/poly-beta-1,6-N-acetylglucosamine synthase-like glycosyltransferase